jgi:hypothetical protein
MTVFAVINRFHDRNYGQRETAMSPRPYSRRTKDALKLLSTQVRLARKQRGMTELELAQRAGPEPCAADRTAGGQVGAFAALDQAPQRGRER